MESLIHVVIAICPKGESSGPSVLGSEHKAWVAMQK
jgi:hypothetical protein